MTKFKNILLLIVFLSGATYGGIKGYLYLKIKNQIDDFSLMVSPYVKIKVDGISSTLDGTVILNKITVRPRGIDDEIKIDTLKIITPGLETLISGTDSAMKGNFPERIGISLKGLTVNLDGELINMMVKSEIETSGFHPEKGLACTFSQSFLTEQYRELGIENLNMDIKVKMERGANSRSAIIKINYSLRDIEEWDAEFIVEEPQRLILGMIGGMQFSPPLKSISINYRPDLEFNQHANKYCAELKGLSVDEFIDQLVNQSDEDYMNDLGFVPGPGIRSAIKRILTNADELRIVALPDESLDLSTLHLYKPTDIPDLLELLVTIDDETIDDLSFTLPEISTDSGETASVKLPIFDMIRNSTKSGRSPKVEPETKQKTKVKELKYHVVKASQLKNKIGLEAYIETSDGKVRSGRIESVENNIISLQIRMHGGTITTHVPLSMATKIEVQEWLE